MKLTTRFLNFLERHDRMRIIPDRFGTGPYLTRYYLFLKDRDWFPINIFLHKFHTGDLDDLHDHPWIFCSIILRSGYWEHTPKGRFWRKAGSIRFSGAKSLHRIELEPDTDVWTIFITGPRVREWGFIVDGQWLDWRTYIKEKRA